MSRCPTCRTRSRSGRPSATRSRKSVIFGKAGPEPGARAAPRRRSTSSSAAVTSTAMTTAASHRRSARPGRTRRWRAPLLRPPADRVLFVAPYALFIVGAVRLPAGPRGVDVVPRLLLRRARASACRRPFVGLDNYRAVLDRSRGAAVVPQHRGLPGHQRAADGGAVAGAGHRAERRDPVPRRSSAPATTCRT